MIKYYRSTYIFDADLITETEFIESGTGYKVYESAAADSLVKEDWRFNKLNYVYYYSRDLTQKIIDYHTSNYPQIGCATCERLPRGLITTHYKDFEIYSRFIVTFLPDGTEDVMQAFNKDFELTEYNRTIFDENGVAIMEKYFWPRLWQIEEDEY
ncbi:hypothetical protein [Chitinophaga sp. Cy-1792]|uniref:hypothetical protein n=1 Tax=Chitinophaga sp. Cy-1792 TaxID=2608339 RepID=UPI00141F8BBD|nr:hypothetical protein [Chitinophaga sp. Cy-1792]NIG55062.1 hypothetical protein [Chitinophaga sp. Cy-1792]